MTTSKNEFERLYGDRWWRLCNLYRIINAQGMEVKFEPNEAQEKLWRNLHPLILIPKARQLGFSTFISIFICDSCVFRSNTTAGIVDIKIDDARAKLEKIKFAYEGLPEVVRSKIRLEKANAHELVWSNGSRVTVGTSHRGGTLQILHVSEYGKISAQYPDKAKEIRTGAFGTIHSGGMIFVESTAEGVGGHFHELVKEADDTRKSGKQLSRKEFALHFAAWHEHPGYVAPPGGVVIPRELEAYFKDLEVNHELPLSDEQKAWYVLQRKVTGPDDMGREYPSYLDEAFAASIEGAYFATQMSKLRELHRIARVPHDPSRPVHTGWDIGKSDNTSVWFFQNHGQVIHLIDYYENSGEGVEHYARVLREKREDRGFEYGKHLGPHDLDNSHWILPGAEATVDVARRMGINFEVVPRIQNKMNAIEAARNFLSMCWIDEEYCTRGVQCLDNYRKLWDEKRATWKSEPEHDWASHGADALMTAACGFTPEYIPTPTRRYQGRRHGRTSSWAA